MGRFSIPRIGMESRRWGFRPLGEERYNPVFALSYAPGPCLLSELCFIEKFLALRSPCLLRVCKRKRKKVASTGEPSAFQRW